MPLHNKEGRLFLILKFLSLILGKKITTTNESFTSPNSETFINSTWIVKKQSILILSNITGHYTHICLYYIIVRKDWQLNWSLGCGLRYIFGQNPLLILPLTLTPRMVRNLSNSRLMKISPKIMYKIKHLHFTIDTIYYVTSVLYGKGAAALDSTSP